MLKQSILWGNIFKNDFTYTLIVVQQQVWVLHGNSNKFCFAYIALKEKKNAYGVFVIGYIVDNRQFPF